MKKLFFAVLALLGFMPVWAQDANIKFSLWDDMAVASPNNLHNVSGFELAFGTRADTFKGFQWAFIQSEVRDDFAGLSLAGIRSQIGNMSGVQLGMIAEAEKMRGVQFGLQSIAHSDTVGLQSGFVTQVEGNYMGIQFGGLSKVEGDFFGAQMALSSELTHFTGLQMSGVTHTAGRFTGVQLGGLNTIEEDFVGFQAGFYSSLNSNGLGVQFGMANISQSYMKGAQVGFFNQAQRVEGLQFGLFNYAESIYGLQIGLVNLARDGWFPVMVLVNGRF